MAELQPIIVFHGRHFVRHFGICNQICVKLVQIMSGVILCNLNEKRHIYLTVFLSSTNAACTQTDTEIHKYTHDDSIRRNAMRCISPRNGIWFADLLDVQNFSQSNYEFWYILLCIDVFARKRYDQPLKTKEKISVRDRFSMIFQDLETPIRKSFTLLQS